MTSDQRGEPTFGGTSMSIGPRTSARPSSHASHLGMASASFFENRAIPSWFCAYMKERYSVSQ